MHIIIELIRTKPIYVPFVLFPHLIHHNLPFRPKQFLWCTCLSLHFTKIRPTFEVAIVFCPHFSADSMSRKLYNYIFWRVENCRGILTPHILFIHSCHRIVLIIQYVDGPKTKDERIFRCNFHAFAYRYTFSMLKTKQTNSHLNQQWQTIKWGIFHLCTCYIFTISLSVSVCTAVVVFFVVNFSVKADVWYVCNSSIRSGDSSFGISGITLFTRSTSTIYTML